MKFKSFLKSDAGGGKLSVSGVHAHTARTSCLVIVSRYTASALQTQVPAETRRRRSYCKAAMRNISVTLPRAAGRNTPPCFAALRSTKSQWRWKDLEVQVNF